MQDESLYTATIIFDSLGLNPHGERFDLLLQVLRTYGDERAAQAEQAVIGIANALPADVDDGFYSGYKLAITNAFAAIRALD